MIIYQDWEVRNSQRKYPLDDSSTGITDSGEMLQDDFLADLNIWVPKYVYSTSPLKELKCLYLSSAAVTPKLVSLTILGSSGPAMPVSGVQPITPEIFTPIAVLTLQKPIIQYKNYAITPLLDGVQGWVAFGLAAVEAGRAFTVKFTKPMQALFAPKSVRFYQNFPVTTLGVTGGFSTVSGDVTISAVEPLVLETRAVTVLGQPKTALVFNLTETEDVLSAFSGPCGQRPESETCDRRVITSFAGVTPDCNGNITIQFDNIDVRWYDDHTGFCVDSDRVIDDLCQANNNLPDDNGILKAERDWVRPCAQVPPYTATLTDVGLAADFIPQAGVWFADSGKVYGVPQDQVTILGPCIPAWKSTGITSRTVAASLVAPTGAVAGVFVMAQGLRRVIIRGGNLWEQTTYGEETDLGSAGGTSAVVTNGKVNGITISDAFWQPNGTCGIWLQQTVGSPSGYLTVNSFTITDII